MTIVEITAAAEPEVAAKKARKQAAIPPAARTAVIERFNREYAVVLIGGSVAVLREGRDVQGRPDIRLLGLDAFREWTRPDKYYSPDGGRPVPVADVWLNDDRRRQYAGIVFDPALAADPSHYNLWRGFAVAPSAEGSCARFLDHVAENICGGDEALTTWVLGWCAHLMQQPAEKLGTALVLRGAQGAGKTIMGEILGSLLGPHYQLVSDPRYVSGRFNGHLAACLLLQLDEGVWGGDHVAAGKLKDLVSSSDQLIEYKGREPVRVRNYTRLFITSNSDWVVPAGFGERRFAVLDVGEAKLRDAHYFGAMRREMREGGRGALLRHLLELDLRDIPLRDVPITVALHQQQLTGISPELGWWVDILMRGQLPGDGDGRGTAPCQGLYDHYLDQTTRRGVSRRAIETSLGISLERFLNGRLVRLRRTVTQRGGSAKRQYVYEFPPLADCRREIARHVRGAALWADDPDAAWAADR